VKYSRQVSAHSDKQILIILNNSKYSYKPTYISSKLSKSEDSREATTEVTQVSTTAKDSNEPEVIKGFLMRQEQGKQIKSWRKRFILVEAGTFKIYERCKRNPDNTFRVENKIAVIILKNASVKPIVTRDKISDDRHYYIVITEVSTVLGLTTNKPMGAIESMFQFDTEALQQQWLEALKNHIAYAATVVVKQKKIIK
jgi:hypothetical protein